jgi:hypothetical protein
MSGLFPVNTPQFGLARAQAAPLFQLTSWLQSFSRYRGWGLIVQAKASKAAAVSLLLIAGASIQAHASPPATPQEPSPLSGIAHDFANWLRGIPYAGTHQRHQTASSVPLPVPRPRAAPVASSSLSNASAAAPKKALVLIND